MDSCQSSSKLRDDPDADVIRMPPRMVRHEAEDAEHYGAWRRYPLPSVPM